MLTKYIEAAMATATYEQMEDGTWFGAVPALPGAWANESTLKKCQIEMREVAEDWLLVGLRQNETLPVIDGISLNLRIYIDE